MDPTPELLNALSRRLRAIEGASAVAAAQRTKANEVKEKPVVCPLRRAYTLPSDNAMFITPVDDQIPITRGRHHVGRVRKPDWVVESGPVDPTKFAPRMPWIREIEKENDTREEAEQRQRLRRALIDRDSALQEVALVKKAMLARSADLDAEVERLRSNAQAFRGEIEAARAEMRQHHSGETNTQANHRLVALTELGKGSADSLAELQSLTHEVGTLATERSALEVRINSLTTELDRQTANRKQLEDQLAVSRTNKELLQRNLDELLSRADLKVSSIKRRTDSFESMSSYSGTPRHETMSVLSSSVNSSSSPRHYNLETPSEPLHDGEDAKNLEFVYDMGLGLSSQMSVERTLKFARWAAAAVAKSHGEQGETNDQGGIEHAEDSEDASMFNDTIATLEKVLQRLKSGVSTGTTPRGPPVPEEDLANGDTMALSAPLQNALQALVEFSHASMDENPDDGSSGDIDSKFDVPLEKLQQVVAQFNSTRDHESSDDHAADGSSNDIAKGDSNRFDAPLENLQHLVAQIGGARNVQPLDDHAANGSSRDIVNGDSNRFDAPLENHQHVVPQIGGARDVEPSAMFPGQLRFGLFGGTTQVQAFIRQKYGGVHV